MMLYFKFKHTAHKPTLISEYIYHGCVAEPTPPQHMPSVRKVWCYPVQFSTPCPRLPTIDYFLERDQTLLRFQGDTVAINTTHFHKLVSVCSRTVFQSSKKWVPNLFQTLRFKKIIVMHTTYFSFIGSHGLV